MQAELDSTKDSVAAPATGFAGYLAQVLIAKKGFTTEIVPELEPLRAACDHLLVKSDGLGFQVACIVDAESDPRRTFDVDPVNLREILQACRAKYCGQVSRTKMSAGLEIFEVRRHTLSSDMARLKPFVSRFKSIICAYLIDTAQGHVDSNRWAPLDMRKGFLQKLLRAPRLSQDALIPPTVPTLAGSGGRPWLTYGMMALLALIFIAEIRLGKSTMDVPLTTLIAMGGLMRPLVIENHEWYRLFTAPLLHGGLLHLAFNCIALLMAGQVLEQVLGRVWLIALFFIGAIGGSCLSLALSDPQIVSIGASGAIMGLLSAAFVTSFRLPAHGGRSLVQMQLIRVLVPSLLPLATGVDYACHFGGAIAGSMAGAFLMARWPKDSPHPRLGPLARVLAVVALVTFLGSSLMSFRNYEDYDIARFLIPDTVSPDSYAAGMAQAEALVRDYPRDPRGHLYRAMGFADRRMHELAVAEMRVALQEKVILQTQFRPEFEQILHTYLAAILIDMGKIDEAKLEVAGICDHPLSDDVAHDLDKLNLCAKT
jgi:rhomboid protease GluP